MNYNVKNKEQFFIKDKGNSLSLVFSKDTQTSFYINETAKYIFNVCDQFYSTEELVVHMKNKFSSVDTKLIDRDVIDFINLLAIYDVVKFETDNSEWVNEGSFVVGDLEYSDVERFIQKNINQNRLNFVCVDNKNYYSIGNLRNRVMNNQEYYFAIKNKEIKVIFSITAPNPNFNSAVVNNMIFEKSISIEMATIYVNEMITKIVDIFNKSITKLRFTLCDNKFEKVEEFIKFIKKIGFYEECLLKNELKDGNLIMYTRVI